MKNAAAMAGYILSDDLSFCLVDARPVFLDVARDRYFRLEGAIETVFLDLIGDRIQSPRDIRPLLDKGIVVEATCGSVAMATGRQALASVLESPPIDVRCGLPAVAEVLSTLLWTRRRLRTRGLKAMLEHVTCPRRMLPHGHEDQARIQEYAATFLRARRFVSIPTRCLLDSLSMAIFLRRRGHATNIVFGVTADPFTAHCWVQAGSIVLNDTVGHTQAFSVIRVA